MSEEIASWSRTENVPPPPPSPWRKTEDGPGEEPLPVTSRLEVITSQLDSRKVQRTTRRRRRDMAYAVGFYAVVGLVFGALGNIIVTALTGGF